MWPLSAIYYVINTHSVFKMTKCDKKPSQPALDFTKIRFTGVDCGLLAKFYLPK